MDFAAEMHLRGVATKPRAEIAELMRQQEIEQGFTPVLAARWLDRNDWHPDSIMSQDGRRIRLVLLQAVKPGNGAFTRLIDGIFSAGLVPTLVEPSQSLIDWCHRHNYRRRSIGHGKFRQQIWCPRRCAY